MVEIWLPYGTSEVPVRVPEEKLIDIFRARYSGDRLDITAEAKKLIASNETFKTRAKEAKSVCIAVGQCGSGLLATDLIRVLLESFAGQALQAIILCTPGATELDSKALLEAKVSHHEPKVSATGPIANFDGTLSPQLNSEFLSAELRIVLGELKPNHFLKYTGICDIVFPGLASETSMRNHLANRPAFKAEDLRKERSETTDQVSNLFALGVVLDSGKEPAHVAFGEFKETLSTLQMFVDKTLTREVGKPADIVIMSAGGTPDDGSLLQAVETFPTGIGMLKRNGALIVAAECGKGHGDTEFYGWTAERKQPHHLEARLRRHFNYDGFKATFLQRALASHRIYLVSTISEYYVENVFGMRAARTVNGALQAAQRALGADSRISVIPDASRIFLRQQPSIPQQLTNGPQ